MGFFSTDISLEDTIINPKIRKIEVEDIGYLHRNKLIESCKIISEIKGEKETKYHFLNERYSKFSYIKDDLIIDLYKNENAGYSSEFIDVNYKNENVLFARGPDLIHIRLYGEIILDGGRIKENVLKKLLANPKLPKPIFRDNNKEKLNHYTFDVWKFKKGDWIEKVNNVTFSLKEISSNHVFNDNLKYSKMSISTYRY